MHLLELNNICKNFPVGKGEIEILKNICFTMEQGEYVAIMGPSGSGKSTLMNLIGCLDTPTSGSYFLDGQEVSGLSENQLSDLRLHKLGFIFQNFQLLPKQTAVDNVCLPLSYAGVKRSERKERAIEALTRVGLAERLNYVPSQLSGGQKQRVAIARALINHPKLILADEPSGALDSKSGKQLMELFRELNEEGVAILMITHDREVAMNASRIVEIRDGILRQQEEVSL